MEMKIPSKGFEEIFPVMSIRDGVVISKRGDVTIGWKLTLPAQYTMNAGDYSDIHNRSGQCRGAQRRPP